MSFFELKDCDIITTVFISHPVTSFVWDLDLTDTDGLIKYPDGGPFYIISGSHITSRTFLDSNDVVVNTSSSISGSAFYTFFTSGSGDSEKVVLNRLRLTYASSSFLKADNYLTSSVWDVDDVRGGLISYLSIPHIFYGTEIKPGSFSFEVTRSGSGGFFTGEYQDDGFGGLKSGSHLGGNIFYQHGIVAFANLGNIDGAAFSPDFTASFSGTNKTPVTMYICRVPVGGLNFSRNPSYTTYISESNRREITTSQPKTFITTINLYDEDYNKIGVAKLANPILNEESSEMVFKLKLAY